MSEFIRESGWFYPFGYHTTYSSDLDSEKCKDMNTANVLSYVPVLGLIMGISHVATGILGLMYERGVKTDRVHKSYIVRGVLEILYLVPLLILIDVIIFAYRRYKGYDQKNFPREADRV